MKREFDWLIHYRCNYRCPYCFFEGMWDEVERRVRYLPADTWIDAWKRVYDAYGDFNLIITGGEPLIYPAFVALVRGLQPLAHISFDTNFSCPDDVLDELLAAVDPSRLFMGLSFHPTHADLEQFLRKAERLKARGVNFRVHCVTYPPHLDRIPAIQSAVMKAGHRFVPIPFRGTFDGRAYPLSFSDQQREQIHAVTRQTAPQDRLWADTQVEQVRSRDKRCHAGQYYARVDSDGTVYPCGNDYTKSLEKNVVGNILEPGFSLRSEPMICRQEHCPCEFRWIAQ